MRKSSRIALILMAVLAMAISAPAALIQHLIATNFVTLSVVTNGVGTVTDWLDDSGLGNHTSISSALGGINGTPKWPSPSLSASGLPGVQFGFDSPNRRGIRNWSVTKQDSWLDFTQAGPAGAQGKSGFAMLVAFKVDSTPTNASTRNIVIGAHGNPGANPSFVLKYESGYPTVYIGNGASNPQYINYNPAAAIQSGDTLVFAFNYNAATGFWELWDSKSNGRMTNTAAINGNFSSAQPLWLGTTDNGAQYMNGMIAEVSIYDNVLSSNDLATARQDMKTRWVTPAGTLLSPSLTSAFGGDTVALLSWVNNNSPGVVSNYYVYRSATSGSSYVRIATNATTSFTDTGLVNGTTNYYVVSALGTNGTESAFSNELFATPVEISTNAVLYQWLDATNAASVIAIGNQVLEWDDLTVNLNNAIPYVGTPLYPSVSLSGSGLVGVDINTNNTGNRAGLKLFTPANSKNWLDFRGNAKTNGGFSALVAFKADQVTNAFNPVLVNNGDTTIAGTIGMKYNNNGVMQLFFNGTTYTKPTPVAAGDTVIFALAYDERTGVVEFWDSKNNSSLVVTNAPYLNLSASDVTMGANSLATHWFNGMIGEVKIYQGKLGSPALLAEGQSLATKWGAVVAATNAYLTSLALSDGTLAPTFSSNVLSYAASVSNAVATITVTPTAAATNATISVRVNGGGYATVASGLPSGALALNVGTNTVDVRVTAQNLAYTNIYTTTVTRAASPAPTPENITSTVSGGNLVLSWTQPSWKLATGTNVTAITNIIPGATSPYTNSLGSDPQRYFRLVYP
jgi:hypothetical protein